LSKLGFGVYEISAGKCFLGDEVTLVDVLIAPAVKGALGFLKGKTVWWLILTKEAVTCSQMHSESDYGPGTRRS